MSRTCKPIFRAPVDFLIVTALDIELEAVLSQFENPQEFYPVDMLRPSYCATIPTENGPQYRVVAMSVFGMGPADAAIATSQMAARWLPGTIMMVGIAAGMPKKDRSIRYGDLLVAEYIHDYEPAKLTPDGPEYRPRQFNADPMLWHRAHAYRRTDWRTRIQVARPGRPQPDATVDIHFGPLASGEKVIADVEQMRALLKQNPKLIGAEMESSGVARAAIQQVNPSRFIAIRAVSDLGDKNKGDKWRTYAAGAAAAFAIGFLHYGPLEPLAVGRRPNKSAPLTRLLLAQSMRKITLSEVFPVLDDGVGRVDAVSLDLTDLVFQGVLKEPQRAVDRLMDPQGPLMNAVMTKRPVDLAFCGHAHIPLAVLIGHVVTDRRSVQLLDYNPTPGAENWVWPGTDERFTHLKRIDSVIDEKMGMPREVILRIAISYPANQTAAHLSVPAATDEIELSVPMPTRSIVRSEEQVRFYATTVRATLDGLEQLSPPVARVHLFYAGPMSLAFCIGQQISLTMHPQIIVWNYCAGRYDWGIDLAAAREGRPQSFGTSPLLPLTAPKRGIE